MTKGKNLSARVHIFVSCAALCAMTMAASPLFGSPWEPIQKTAQEIFDRNSPCVVGITVRSKEGVGEAGLEAINLDGIMTTSAGKNKQVEAYIENLLFKKRVATGVVVDPQGFILTTSGVVRNASREEFDVTLHDGSVLAAELIALDTPTNLALFKVDRRFETPPNFAPTDKARIGSFILGISRPYGRSNSLFIGTISNIGQELGQSRYEDLLQTTLPLHPGSIGSPVFDYEGRIVGLLATTQKQSSWPELSFAIPGHVLEFISNQMMLHGEVVRGFLGVWVYPLNEELKKSRNIPDSVKGVIVTRTVPGGPADDTGIRPGDIIVRFNEHPIRSYQELIWQTAVAPLEQEIPVEIWRNGSLNAQFMQKASSAEAPLAKTDVVVQEASPEQVVMAAQSPPNATGEVVLSGENLEVNVVLRPTSSLSSGK